MMEDKKITGSGKDYDFFLTGMISLLEQARRYTARSVNAILTATYWEIGRRIVEFEQKGNLKADYGTQHLKQLGADLTCRFGRGFGWRNLYQMRGFFLVYRDILQTPSAKSKKEQDYQTLQKVSAKLKANTIDHYIRNLAEYFPLSWSHYVRLLAIDNTVARSFYEAEALHGDWSVRQLDRQISSRFYERTLLSKNKSSMLRKGALPKATDEVTAEEEIKDPYILEFLGLRDEYSENDLEEALIYHLEHFLLELGTDFAFVGRQKRLRIGDEWFRVDLLFFHRRLCCLVIIDLKIGKFTHADAGQMHMYLNYARQHCTHERENPPICLILCAQKNDAVAKYSLEGISNKILVSEYRLQLPEEKVLE